MCFADAVSDATLPNADGALDGVGRVVVRLDNGEHLARLLRVVAVLEGVARAFSARLEDVVAFADQHRREVQPAPILGVFGSCVSLAVEMGVGFEERVPVKSVSFARCLRDLGG